MRETHHNKRLHKQCITMILRHPILFGECVPEEVCDPCFDFADEVLQGHLVGMCRPGPLGFREDIDAAHPHPFVR